MTERDWKTVVANLRSGHCVLFVGPETAAATKNGAASSQSSEGATREPSHQTALCRHLVAQLEAEGHRVLANTLSAVAQQYFDLWGRKNLTDEVQAFYRDRTEVLSSLYLGLACLPFPLVVTSGHDRDLERALKQAGKSPEVTRYHFRSANNPAPSLPPSLNAPVVYYLHGTAADPESLVLTDSDFIEFLVSFVKGDSLFPPALKAYLQRRETSFLFVGFGLRHWYLRLLLHALAISQENLSTAVEPLGTLATIDRDDLVLFYRRGKISVYDVNLGEFVAELSQRFEQAGGLAVSPALPGVRPRVFISYASEDGSFASQLHEQLSQAGFDTWLDRVRLESGDRWDPKIEDAIDLSDYIVVLQSPRLLAKPDSYVNKEIRRALIRAERVRPPFKCVVPFCLEPCDPHPDLKSFQTHAVAADSFDACVLALHSLIARDYQLRERERSR